MKTRAWIILTVGILLAGLGGASAADRPDLTGQVQSADGRPLQATVFISTAGPKVGTSPFCPSCYADCRKSATADTNGDFKIESLDPELIFRILVVAKNYKPKYVGKVDPAKGPVKAKLEPLSMANAPPENTVRGRVLDSHGAPVVGAAVEAHGIHTRDGGARWGGLEGVDPLAVTDNKGEFFITSRQALVSMDVKVQARGLANKTFTELSAGSNTPHDLTMTEGASLKGRVLFKGKPLANVSMGVVSVDRGMDNFTGDFDIGTDADGRFEFVNLPPNVRYDLYGLMKSLQPYGCIPVLEIETSADGSTTDAGDLTVVPAHRLSGRVVLSDGAAIPPKTRLMIGRPHGWDSMLIPLDKDGHFDVGGIPDETISLSIYANGYHPSIKNASLDQLNPFELQGRVNRDITNLLMLMDRGPELESHFDSQQDDADMPENKPLHGAESAGDHSRQQMISGRVTDAKTGAPVARFRVSPGWRRNDTFSTDDFDWNPFLGVDGSNGSYVIYLDKHPGQVELKVEGAGYMPMVSPPLSNTRSNYDFALNPGVGPSGTVLLPDGYPAAGVRVLLICPAAPGRPYLCLSAEGTFNLNDRDDNTLLTKTDADGHFTLPPQLEMSGVAAASSAGFKMVTLETLRTNSQLTLEPWGTLKGVLRRTNAPSRNETLDLRFAGTEGSRGEGLTLNMSATTDDQGAFEFDNVPPVACDIQERIPMSRMGWQSDTLQVARVAPGRITEVNIQAGARPAAPAGSPYSVSLYRAPKPLTVKYIMHGTVARPDGQPAADAQVGLKSPRQFLQLGDGELRGGARNDSLTRTDEKGAFTLPIRDKATALLAVSEAGYARVTPESWSNGLKIVLQPWAQVKGMLRVNGKPGAKERIALTPEDNDGGYSPPITSMTDEKGGFTYAHVPPGNGMVCRYIHLGNAWTTANPLYFTIQAGATTNVILGGTGRPVVGKCVVEGFSNLPDSSVEVDIHTQFPRPPGTGTNGYVSQRQWREWQKSEAGKNARHNFHQYHARAAEDGSFQVDDVPPGTYELSFSIQQEQMNSSQYFQLSEPKPITVPPPPGADQYARFDVGTVKSIFKPPAPAPPSAFAVGATAPAIATKTLAGQPLRLADYRGKYVLLNFSFELPAANADEIQAVRDSFAKDGRLTFINLSQDADDDFIKALPKDPRWICGNLDSDIMINTYGINQFPMAVLLDPEGKVVATGLRAEEIQSTVATALAKK